MFLQCVGHTSKYRFNTGKWVLSVLAERGYFKEKLTSRRAKRAAAKELKLKADEGKATGDETMNSAHALASIDETQSNSDQPHASSPSSFPLGPALPVPSHNDHDSKARVARLRLLDVGALTNHYLAYADLIECTAIDLNPMHPSVVKKDFFDLDPLDHRFDVVVLSLVINFLGMYTHGVWHYDTVLSHLLSGVV